MSKLNMSKLNKFLELINTYTNLGNITVLDLEQARSSHADVRDTDICIFYDFSTDEASDDEQERFVAWLWGQDGNIINQITQYMKYSGYYMIEDVDGSGGGLYYGSLQFRKKI